jgi:hypothetical protein
VRDSDLASRLVRFLCQTEQHLHELRSVEWFVAKEKPVGYKTLDGPPRRRYSAWKLGE